MISLGRIIRRARTGLGPLLLIGLVTGVLAAPTAYLSTTDDAIVVQGNNVDEPAHHVRDITVDNTGDRIGVTVDHWGAAWSGTVTVRFDVKGGPRPELVAVLHRGLASSSSFTTTSGADWPCDERDAHSVSTSTVTQVTGPRRCFDGAPKLRAVVEVQVDQQPVHVASSRVVQRQTRPNVVLIMLDDMRDDDLEHMPLTRSMIGGQGVQFVNSLAPYPLCCPARASVLTGQYAHNHKVWSHRAPWGFGSFDDRSTLATWLQGAGYHTTYIGKYLNGYGPQPPYGQTSGTSTLYVPPGWSDWRASIDGGLAPDHPANGGTYRYMDTTLSDNGRGFIGNQGRYQTKVYGALSEKVVTERAASPQPFFFNVSYAAPHHGSPTDPDDPQPVLTDAGSLQEFKTPMVPSASRGIFDDVITEAPGASWFDHPAAPRDRPDYLADLTPMNDGEKAALLEVTRQRAEALSIVDQAVADTIAALEGTGELEDTMVLFTSDNGFFLGEQGIRTGKTLPHEPSIHTPLLVRGPGIPAGEIRYDPFLSIDFAPTIADFTGVTPGAPVDGKSMLPVARDGDTGWKRAVLTETGPRRTVRETDESGEPLSTEDPGEADVRYAIGVRSDRYLYVHLANGDEELYDMAVDPSQYDNLVRSEQHARVLELMRRQLQVIRACDEQECRSQLPHRLAAGPGESILNKG